LNNTNLTFIYDIKYLNECTITNKKMINQINDSCFKKIYVYYLVNN